MESYFFSSHVSIHHVNRCLCCTSGLAPFVRISSETAVFERLSIGIFCPPSVNHVIFDRLIDHLLLYKKANTRQLLPEEYNNRGQPRFTTQSINLNKKRTTSSFHRLGDERHRHDERTGFVLFVSRDNLLPRYLLYVICFHTISSLESDSIRKQSFTNVSI